METIRIEIKTKEVTLENGQKFFAHETFKKDGTRMTLKFKKEVENSPKKVGVTFAEIDTKDCNISNKKKFPEMWVAKILNYIEPEQLQEEKASKIAEMFRGGDDEKIENNNDKPSKPINPDDLPF